MRSLIVPAMALLSSAAVAHGQVTPGFHPLGDLPGGTFSSRATGVASDGSAIVGRSNDGSESGVIWFRQPDGTWSAPMPLPRLAGGSSAEGRAVIFNGIVAFGDANTSAGFRQPVIWTITPGTPAGPPAPIPYPATGGYSGVVYACAADGGVACGEYVEAQVGLPPPLPITRAFRWTFSMGMVNLGTIPGVTAGPGHMTIARACSHDGTVIVGNAHDNAFTNRPWRWTGTDGMVDISAGQWPGIARGVSPDGNTVVGSFTDFGLSKPFRWTAAGGREDLQIPLFYDSGGAFDATDDGRACGLVLLSGSGKTAVLWDSAGQAQLVSTALINAGVSMPAWQLQSATAMSDDGTVIVGFGLNPDGQQEAWVAVLPAPCPADFDGNGEVEVPDIFAFLSAWFAMDPGADIDGVPGIGVPDIFFFLSLWFAGCD